MAIDVAMKLRRTRMVCVRAGCKLMIGLVLIIEFGCQQVSQEVSSGQPIDLYSGNNYQCKFTEEPIVLDGELNERAWQEAQRVERFQLYRPAGSYSHTTVGRLTWDDEHLYVAFECTDDDVRSASNTHDDYLAAGDVVELYIKYSGAYSQYYELVGAPNGTSFDARWPYRGAGDYKLWTPWESGMRIATTVWGTPDQSDDIDKGFTVEMAIPWSSFDGVKTPPNPGSAWTFGLFRYDYSARFCEAYLTMSLSESPEHGFHYYERYHQIVFKKSRHK